MGAYSTQYGNGDAFYLESEKVWVYHENPVDKLAIPELIDTNGKQISKNGMAKRKAEKRPSAIEGDGLFARTEIGPDEFICEVEGEVMSKQKAERSWRICKRSNIDSIDLANCDDRTSMLVNKNCVGYAANHGCEANACLYIFKYKTKFKIAIYSKTTASIRRGSEILLNYGIEYDSRNPRIRCMCKLPQCKRFLDYIGSPEHHEQILRAKTFS